MNPRFTILITFLTALLAVHTAAQSPEPTGTFILENVSILPMDREVMLHGQSVVIEDGLIKQIGPTDEITPPAAAISIDGRGKTLLPGLFDMHMHLNEPEKEELLILYLASGITSVQSMHGSPYHLDLRARLERGERIGPRLVTTGPTTARERIDSPEKAERVIAAQKAAGYDAIKMYGDGSDSMTRETYYAVIEAAHARNMRVVGHAPRNMPFSVVLEAGQDSIDHMEEIVYTDAGMLKEMGPLVRLQFGSGDSQQVRRALEGLGDLVDRLRPAAKELALAVNKAGLVVTPTLVTFETIWRQTTPEYEQLLAAKDMRFVHPITRANWGPERNRYRNSGWKDRLDAMSEVLGLSFELQLMLVGAFHEAGVTILAGTDAPLIFVYPGSSLHRELHLLHRAGLSPFEVIVAATIAPARELGMDDLLGTVEVGKAADLLLVEGNPLDDLANLTNLVGVFSRGRWLPRAELERQREELASAYAPLAETVAALIKHFDAGEAEEAVDLYYSMEADDQHLADLVEDETNRLGYALMRSKDTDRALEVFELNCQSFPQSANVWDSFAEAQMNAGNRELAIRYYSKSLELNPDNSAAKATLQRLRSR